jgi:hypothetical protein
MRLQDSGGRKSLDLELHCGLMRLNRLGFCRVIVIRDAFPQSAGRLRQVVMGASLMLALAGCGTLPNDGPSAKVVENPVKPTEPAIYSLVNLDYRVTQAIDSVPAVAWVTR